MADQSAVPDSLLRSILSPLLQPGAQLSQTQQSTATSGQEQQNLQAQLPGQVASSSIDQVNALKAQASLGAAKDIQSGMTWDQARRKYTALGMNPDDIFNQYLANSSYGPPKETPTQLLHQGVTQKSLGNVGDTGSYNDMYNVRNAVEGVRTAEDLFNKITPNDLLQYKLTGTNGNVAAYQNQRTNVGNHLSSLIPGASQSAGTGRDFVSELPDPSNPKNFMSDIGSKSFKSIENSLLTTKNYKPEDLGLTPYQAKDTTTGKELLDTVLKTAKDVTHFATNPIGSILYGQIKGQVNDAIDTTNETMHGMKSTGNPLSDALTNTGVMASKTITPSHIAEDTISALGARFLPPALSKIIDSIPEAGGGAAKAAVGNPIDKIKLPSDLMTKINPASATKAGFALKDNHINAIDSQPNGGVNGDAVASNIKSEIPILKKSFSGVTNKDVAEILKGVSGDFKGKLSGADAEKIYNTIPDSYTSTGNPKQDFASAVNLVKKKALSLEIENAAPGQGWKEGVKLQGKAYKAQKGQPSKILKNLPYNASRAGLNLAGLGFLKEFMN